MKVCIIYAVLCFATINTLEATPFDPKDVIEFMRDQGLDPIVIPSATRDRLEGRLICNDINIKGLSGLALDPNAPYNSKYDEKTKVTHVNMTIMASNLDFKCDAIFYKTVILRFEGHAFGTIGNAQIPIQITIDPQNKATIDKYRFVLKNIEWDLTPTTIRTELVYNRFTKWAVQSALRNPVNEFFQIVGELIMQMIIERL